MNDQDDNAATTIGDESATKRKSRNEAMLESILEHLPVGVWVVNVHGELVRANPEAIRIWGGVRDDSALDLTCNAWFVDSGRKLEAADWPSHVSLTTQEAVLGVEVGMEALDGVTRRIVVSSVPLFGASNDFLGVVVMNHDVTDYREAEEELRQSQRWFRTLLEHSDEIISTIAPDGTILFATQPVHAVLGYAADERIGRTIFELLRPEDVERARDHLARQSRSDRPLRIEFDVLDVRGTSRTLEVATSRFVAESGQIQIIANSRDITDRNTMARALEQATRLGSLGRLAATIAHEINNVLMSIQTFAGVVARHAVGQRQLEIAVEQIMGGIRRGKQITAEILRFARPAPPQRTQLSVRELFETVQSELEALLPESIRLHVRVPSEDCWISADRDQMAQVFANLVINARDAMPRGGTIRIASSARDGWMQIIVSDTGVGIPAETLDQIFEPLFTTKARGTGLGLAIVQQIVVRHGGSIAAASEVGRGTTFTITMPLAKDET